MKPAIVSTLRKTIKDRICEIDELNDNLCFKMSRAAHYAKKLVFIGILSEEEIKEIETKVQQRKDEITRLFLASKPRIRKAQKHRRHIKNLKRHERRRKIELEKQKLNEHRERVRLSLLKDQEAED